MSDQTISVWAFGDPRDSATWSGTPKAITDAFESAGVTVVTKSGGRVARLDNAIYSPAAIVFGRAARQFRQFWGPIHQRNTRVWSSWRSEHPDIPVIHTDHMWLSPDSVGRRDFIYRDGGWSRWALNRGLHPRIMQSIGADYGEILRRVGAIFATSEWAAAQLIHDGAPRDRVFIVGTGVGNLIQPFEGPKDVTRGQILSIAKVRPHDKGVDTLVTAMEILNAQGKPWTLDLVVAESPGPVPPNVRLHYRLPADEIVSLFRNASVFALPARNEPYGLVYLEALLSQTPIIGTANGAFPEFAGEGKRGFVVAADNPLELANLLDEALNDHERLLAMGLNGVDYARQATWSNTVAKISHHIDANT